MFKKIFLSLKLFFVSLFLLFNVSLLSSCNANNFIYLANFESYMSPQLMDNMKRKHSNLKYRFYETNEVLERNFVKYYDIAIPSTYLVAKLINENKLEKIDWSRFKIPGISNAQDALGLFTKEVQNILLNVYTGPNQQKINLLEYGVPYFLQDLIFGYKSQTEWQLTNKNWENVITKLADEKKKNNINKIAMIDDYRTVFSIPRLIQTNNQNVNPNISSESDLSINSFKKTYSYLANGFERNSFLLNSDSNNILNNFASPKGSNAGIMYNGDLLYAFLGGDEAIKGEFNNYNFIRPTKTLMALDMMVINKNSKFIDDAYNIIKEVALEGVKVNITESNELGKYIYGPMLNFDYILYTSPLQCIYEYVTIGNSLGEKYFDYLLKENYDQNFINKCIEIFNISQQANITNTIEIGLSGLAKSNMSLAYSTIKENM